MRGLNRPPVECTACRARIYWPSSYPYPNEPDTVEANSYEPPPLVTSCPRCQNPVNTADAYPVLSDYPPRFNELRNAWNGFAAEYEFNRQTPEDQLSSIDLCNLPHELNTGDGRVASVLCKRPDGTEERAVGKVFVIAAHGVETPKLLLQSRTEPRPAGVANSSDQVGRNLMDHPTQLSWALAGERMWNYRGPLSTAGIESGRAGDWRAERPSFRIQISNSGWGWPTGAPHSTVADLWKRGLRGAALDSALVDHSTREFTLACMTEQLPSAENRVVPDYEKRDALGWPRPRIHFRIDEYTRRGLEHARSVHQRIFAAMKSSDISHDKDIKPAGHLMGTYRMGNDPKQSVVDANLRSHDHANLFLLGSGVFPTGGASNPTLTIAALALRAVGEIKRGLGN